MFLKTRTYRFVVYLLAVILLSSFNGATFAYKDACPCCNQTAQSGHMQSPSKADCCNTTACDHCAINSTEEQDSVAAVNGPRGTWSQYPTQFFTIQTIPGNNQLIHWENTLKNSTLEGNHLKLPLYLQLQSFLC